MLVIIHDQQVYIACLYYNVHVRYMSSQVCLSSVTFVHPTQAIEIFRNISTPLGTLANGHQLTSR